METGGAASPPPKKDIAGAPRIAAPALPWRSCTSSLPDLPLFAAKFRALEAAGTAVPMPAAAKAAPAPAPAPAPVAPPPKKAGLGSVLGGAPPCPRCAKSVYAAERVLGPGGDWHRACLRCAACARGLAAGTWSEHKGEAYCGPCHEKAYGPKGVRGGAGGGMMHAA